MKNFRQQHRPKKSSLVAGRRQIIESIKAGRDFDRVYLDKKLQGQDLNEIKALAASKGIPVNYVPVEKLNSFNIPGHEGCIAQLSRVHYQDLQQIISFVTDRGDSPLFLMLDGITDIRNIGGIARTAYCMGVHALIIPEKGVGALNEDAILTSAGALENIAVCRVNSLVKAVDDLHMNGIKVYATEMTARKDIRQCDFREPCCIIMGSEEKGIFPTLMKVCDEKIKIPMKGDFESLNVSVATGMILYEVMRQRSV